MRLYEPRADLTARQAPMSAGMTDNRLLFMCGTAKNPHKGERAGAHFWRRVPMRCPDCNKESK